MRFRNIAFVVALVLLTVTAAPAQAAQIKYSVHDTGTEFSAGTLNGLQVVGDRVTTEPSTFSVNDINTDTDWTLLDDPDGTWSAGSPLEYYPGDSDPRGQILRYDGFETNGRTGTMKITGDMEAYDFDDGERTQHMGPVVVEPDGVYYGLVMASGEDTANGDGDFVLVTGHVGTTNWATLTGGFAEYIDHGGAIGVTLKVDHDNDQICGIVDGPNGASRCVGRSTNAEKFGVTGSSGGKDYVEFDNLDVSGDVGTGGTYTSQAHDIDDPSQAELDIDLSGGEADVAVTDGNGNTLGSATYTSGGTKTLSLSPSTQVGSEAYVEVNVTDTGDAGVSFDMYEESLYYDNDPPGGTNMQPADGDTLHTEHPAMNFTVTDPQFDEVQGDSVTVDFYTDKDGHVTQKGPFTSDTQVGIYYDERSYADGSHWWYAEVTDQHGNTWTMPKQNFDISHYSPTLDGTSASPDGATSDSAEQTLSIDATDGDFAVDGDTLTADWYINGTNVATTTHNSDGTISHTTDPLDDGDYQWHVEVSDAWGNSVTSSTYYFTVQHGPTDISSLSPTGTTQYATNTFSAHISDPDFSGSGGGGDSVDVRFYVDGSLEYTETITSEQDVTTSIGPLADGSHDWYVETEDKFGYTATSATETVTVQHNDPSLSSPTPTGTIADSEPSLQVDVSDDDFGLDGDSVTVEFFVDGSSIGTDTVTSGAQASVQAGPLADGSYTWHAEATDSYGRTDSTTSQSLTVSHDPPSLSGASPTGTVNYEDNVLSVDLSDDDFSGEGDTVDIVFHLNGQQVATREASSAGTYTYQTGPLADGTHTWNATATDSYGLTGGTGDLSYTIEHYAPTVDNPSLDGTTRYETNSLEVDVADGDFPVDGDSVDVEFFVDGASEGTVTLTSNGTAVQSVGPLPDGNYDWHVEWEDDYGNSGTSPTWSMDIEHYEPVIESTADPGTTNREDVQVEVDVSDGDFVRDGDVIIVEWYANGIHKNTTTLNSPGTTTATFVEMNDGTYSWSVELSDEYGHTVSSNVQSFEVNHYAPVADDSSMKPTNGTTLTEYTTTFSVDVNDTDFADPTANEEVDATLVVGGDEQATTTLTSNGTASVEVIAGYGGDVDYHWELEDKYGYTDQTTSNTITSPGNLTIYNELDPTQTISTGEGEAVFYFSYEDGTDNAETRNITDNTVDMGGLPTDESFVVVARADGYYNRRVWVESLFGSDRMYVLPDDADVVQQSFELQDYTGNYPLDETVLEVQKSINGSWETVDGDFFGADDKLNSILAYNDRHRIVIRNVRTNQTRELGTLFPVASGTVELRVFSDREKIYQANVPNVLYEPDIDALPAANGTDVNVGFDPRDSGADGYTVVAELDGSEVHNETYNDTEDATMTLDLSGHRGEQLRINVTYTGDEGEGYSQRTYDVGRAWSERGLVGGALGFLGELGTDLAGLVAVLVSGLMVAFAAPFIGPRASGTVAVMGLGAFTLLGFMQVPWFAVGAAAYFVLLGRRWYP